MKRNRRNLGVKATFAAIVLVIILLSIGWSSFNSTMTIDSGAVVRIFSEIRVTDFSLDSVSNNAFGTYENFGVDFVTADVSLPNANSTITYKVEITNLQLGQGVEVGILDAFGLPENLSILSWSGYTLEDKICDDTTPSNCGTGAQKTFYITVGYTNSTYYDSNNTNYKFDIHFDFREFHSITYTNIVGNYPDSVMDGADLSITLNNITALELEVDGTNEYEPGTDYTFQNNNLVVPSVYEDLLITKLPSYTVTYNANGGTYGNSVTTNNVTYVWRNNQNNVLSGTERNPTNGNKSLLNWYTDNVNYTTVFDPTTELHQNITVYAKWVDAVAELNGQLYTSLKSAIGAVQTNDVETTVRLLKDTTDSFSVTSGQNIVVNLQNHTVTGKNGSGALLTVDGTIRFMNGSLTSAVTTDGVINVNSSGILTLQNTNVSMTKSNGKQAVYSYGIVEIMGTSFLTSNSKNRATVQTLSGATLRFTGGTIESTGSKSAVANAGTMYLGVKDGVVNNNDPMIVGKDYGIEGSGSIKFFDGVVKGISGAIKEPNRVNDRETGYALITESEAGTSYEMAHLAHSNTVRFLPNGGVTLDGTRSVNSGQPVGALPSASRNGYVFVGWFTSANGGTQIDANYIITQDIDFYAHWTREYSAEINGTYYYSLQDAVDAAPDNTRTEITLLRDAGENAEVVAGKNIYLDLSSYTLSFNGNNAVIEVYGTLEVYNGTLTTASNAHSAINIRPGGDAIIDSVNIISTGTRQAVYNYTGGTAEIRGNSYISSKTSGTASGALIERGTVQNQTGATLTIKGGTFIGVNQQAISNEGDLTIGIKQDGVINTSTLVIQGKTYGIKSLTAFNWYDGLVKGMTGAISGSILDQEPNTTIIDGSESIDGNTYLTQHLEH